MDHKHYRYRKTLLTIFITGAVVVLVGEFLRPYPTEQDVTEWSDAWVILCFIGLGICMVGLLFHVIVNRQKYTQVELSIEPLSDDLVDEKRDGVIDEGFDDKRKE